MPKKKNNARFVIVDTNCFLRLYYSPVRPLLGGTFGGYRLVTLQRLVAESCSGPRISNEYAWALNEDAVKEELKKAALRLREPKKGHVKRDTGLVRKVGNGLLKQYCLQEAIRPRELSLVDAELLATAMQLDGIVASDEWPLRHVGERYGDEPVPFLTSVEVLHVLESAGALAAEARISVVRDWLRAGEKLHRDWRDAYRRCFNDGVPTAQEDDAHKT